jgi:hypothetical protein
VTFQDHRDPSRDSGNHLQGFVCVDHRHDVRRPTFEVALEVIEAADVEAIGGLVEERTPDPVLEKPDLGFDPLCLQTVHAGPQDGLDSAQGEIAVDE